MQFNDGTTITFYSTAPGSFVVVQANNTGLPVHTQMTFDEVPAWASSIDERDVLGLGVVTDMDVSNAGPRRRQINMASLRNGRANAISNNT